jgi:RNA polymerase sigma factor (sigma-70 family)
MISVAQQVRPITPADRPGDRLRAVTPAEERRAPGPTQSHQDAVLRSVSQPEVYRSLLRYAQRLCRDQYLAEDLVQDVIVRAIEQAAQFQGNGTVEGWLKAILRTTFLMVVRAKREWPAAVRDGQVPSAEEEALDNLTRAAVREYVSTILSDRDRLLVDLYYGQGLGLRGIARLLDSTECAVKCHLYRLRRRVASEDLKQGDEPAVPLSGCRPAG